MIGAAFGAVALTSLVIDPMSWVGDYPPDVRAAASGSSSSSIAFQVLTAGALLVVVLGGLGLSVRRLDRENASLGFVGVTLHVFWSVWW